MARTTNRMRRSPGFARIKARVVAVLAAIPEGRVTTYGTIARHVKATARQVAFVLATLTMEESHAAAVVPAVKAADRHCEDGAKLRSRWLQFN
jgi:alkylated DNA nucleotide flippase Atl1